MILKSLTLKHLRNHKKKFFTFSKTTIIIGRNTAGKTNIIEALYILSHGT
jgi:recombinational DNA repair ATPase RecF